MFIKGKTVLTHSGLMLDEVRSLLQKALRRKESEYVVKATFELVGHDKDLLPCRYLMTFLFEDHCMVDNDSMALFFSHLQSKKKTTRKVDFIRRLLSVPTCRIAACLPVFAMHPDEMKMPHLPSQENISLFCGLVTSSSSVQMLDADGLLTTIWRAWSKDDKPVLIASVKLASLMEEIEGRYPTDKGTMLVVDMLKWDTSYSETAKKKKVTLTQMLLALFLSATKDASMREFLFLCIKFSLIKDAPARLILFTAVARKVMDNPLTVPSPVPHACLQWHDIGPLTDMPEWAVDKHTFRGRHGRTSSLTTSPEGMDVASFAEFHGSRQQRDIDFFFAECHVEPRSALPSNPFWEKTKEVYRAAPSSRQKTKYIGRDFYKKLIGLRPDVFVSGSEVTLPLLQVPTSGAKVYTRCDLTTGTVVKGPYKPKSAKHTQVMANHMVMNDIFGDIHTLPYKESCHEEGHFVLFPLLKHDDVEHVQVTRKSFSDPISNTMQTAVDFVEREALGLRQVHKMSVSEVRALPVTLWVHFCLRFALNIGDSGLYNVLYDGRNAFGVPMEEMRGRLKSRATLCDLLFTKKPRKQLCTVIEERMHESKLSVTELLTVSKRLGRDKLGSEFQLRLDIGILGTECEWFKDYLHERQQVVKLGGILSNPMNIDIGVPQGSQLGPLLFSLYVNDLPAVVKQCLVNLFADDTALYYSSPNVAEIQDKLQADMNNISAWLEENSLVLNVKKTKVMLIGTQARVKSQQLKIIVDGEKLDQVDHYKYVGVTIDSHLSWDKHLDKVVAKAKFKLMLMRKNKAYINQDLLKLMYTGLIRPNLEYCGALFTKLTKKQTQKLEVLQNDAMRVILGKGRRDSATEMRENLHIPTLQSRRYVKLASIIYKALNSEAPEYLTECLHKNHNQTSNTRSRGWVQPKCNIETFKASFEYQSTVIWTKLSEDAKASQNSNIFKNNARKELLTYYI